MGDSQIPFGPLVSLVPNATPKPIVDSCVDNYGQIEIVLEFAQTMNTVLLPSLADFSVYALPDGDIPMTSATWMDNRHLMITFYPATQLTLFATLTFINNANLLETALGNVYDHFVIISIPIVR
jgi:hypothetical protein